MVFPKTRVLKNLIKSKHGLLVIIAKFHYVIKLRMLLYTAIADKVLFKGNSQICSHLFIYIIIHTSQQENLKYFVVKHEYLKFSKHSLL